MNTAVIRTIVAGLLLGAAGIGHAEVFSAWKALTDMASRFSRAGDYDKAIGASTQALHMAEHVFGMGDVDVGVNLNSLCWLYSKKEDYAQAEPYCVRALGVAEKSPAPNGHALTQALYNLAELHDRQDHYALAVRYFERCTEAAADSGPDRQVGAAAWHRLATLRSGHGEPALAEYAYRQALNGFETGDPRILEAELQSFGDFHARQKQPLKAQPLYERSLQLAEQVPEPARSSTAIAANRMNLTNHLADIYRGQGRYEDAFVLYERALAIAEQGLGPTNHPKLVLYLEALVPLYREIGKGAEASALEAEAATRRAKAAAR